MTVLIGRLVGQDFCRALGLDPSNIREIVIEIMPESAVIATVEQYVTTEQLEAIIHVVKNRYRLELIESETNEEWR
jgi:hypothetical protein